MVLKWQQPTFWFSDSSQIGTKLKAGALAPLSLLWRGGAALKAKIGRYETLSVPVISVGSPVIGGSGKTPVVIALATQFKEHGLDYAILSRGYGRTNPDQSFQVTPDHTPQQVGDEPFMMNQLGLNVWVGADRAEIGRRAIAAGARYLILDDGMQQTSLTKDYEILVMDGASGFGNGHLIPAGPLRESVSSAIKKAGMSLVIGVANPQLSNTLPAYKQIEPRLEFDPPLSQQPYIAFAGIGRPQKFFDALSAFIDLKKTISFADHHCYSVSDEEDLCALAGKLQAGLITSDKDYGKLSPSMQKSVTVAHMTLDLKEEFNQILSCLT